MAQVQIRDQRGNPITSVAVRLATEHQSSELAYDERFTDLAGNTAFPAPALAPSYTLHVNYTDDCCRRNLRAKYKPFSLGVPNLNDDIVIVLEDLGSSFTPEVGALRVEK